MKKQWTHTVAPYNGSSDIKDAKLYYTKKMKGEDFLVCEVNGEIIEKVNLKHVVY